MSRRTPLPAAARCRAWVCALALAAALPASASPERLRSFEETIVIDESGDARVTWRFVPADNTAPGLLLPWNFPAPAGAAPAFRVRALGGAVDDTAAAPPAAALETRGGVAFLRVTRGDTRDSSGLEVAFPVPGLFAKGAQKTQEFGNTTLRRRFVNTTLAEIGRFTSAIELPPGMVVTSVEETVPTMTEDNPVSPYRLDRAGDRTRVTLTAPGMKLGDQALIRLRVKPGARSPLLFIALSCIAVAYLVMFRDLIAGGNGDADKPKTSEA